NRRSDLRLVGGEWLRPARTRRGDRARLHALRSRRPGRARVVLPQSVDDAVDAGSEPRDERPPGGVSAAAPSDTAAYVPYNPRPYGGHERLLALAGSPGRVLDVGCSTGYLARRLVEHGAVVVGIEADKRAAAEARAVCEEVLVGDVETMSLPWPDRSFDVVICGDLIEHLRDPERFLVRVRPLLRPGGRLVLTTPNVANWRSEEHTSELQSRGHLVCRLLLEKKTDTQTTA